MIKKLFLTFSIFFFITATYASYLKNVPQTIQQPDGRVIHCFASGDEFHNWLHDSAGFTIIKNTQTGFYTYAVKIGEELYPSEYIVGVANPYQLELKPHTNISADKWIEKRKSFEALTPQLPFQKTSGKNHGKINNLVFFIRFSNETDESFSTSYTSILNKFNDSSSLTANSLYNYYRLTSYGKLCVNSYFYPTSNTSTIYSFQDSFPRNYYLKYDSLTNPNGYKSSNQRRNREHALLKRAVLFFQDSVPESLNLDYNNDGNIDNVCFVTSGSPAGWSDLMWPHRWSLTSYELYINNKRVYDYNFIMESYMYVGIITHEFMHTLSAPDLYRYKDDENITPVGPWDLMASTNYSKPQGLGAYMKYKYGNWIDSIPTIYKNGTYTLYPANGTRQDKIAYKIPIEGESDQFLLVEYRKTSSSTFESSLAGSGMLIYRIDERFNGNASYNGYSILDEVYLFRPGGTPNSQGSLSQAHFNEENGRTVFNETSNPFPFLSEGDIVHEIFISNISRTVDSIQFTIGIDTTVLRLDTNNMLLENQLDYLDTFSITANTTWSIQCDTSWISLSASQGSGNAQIIVSSKQTNTTTINREVELSVLGHSRIKTLHITQKPVIINKCMAISNILENDTLTEFTFPYSDSNNYVNAASEYFLISDEITIDSLAIYFGNLQLSSNDTVIIRISNTTSLKTPTTIIKTIHLSGDQIQALAWNTIVLEKPIKTVKHFCVYYILPGNPGDEDSSYFVLAQNKKFRNNSYSTGFLRYNNYWYEPKTFLFNNYNYSLPIRLYVCPTDISIKETSQKEAFAIKLYPNPAKEMLHIETLNSSSAIVNFTIYNIKGQMISTFINRNTSETQSINIGNLASGMYFLKVSGSDFSKVKSFIVE